MTIEAATLGKRIASLSEDKRKLFKARLAGRRPDAAAGESDTILRRPAQSTSVLSYAQQRLWFLDQLVPGNPFYTESSATRFQGALNVPALERAINEIVRRHEVLRTTFRLVDGRPEAVVAPELRIALSVTDLGQMPPPEQDKEILRLATEESRRPFQLERGPLLRTALIKCGPLDWIFLASLHHIVCDAWSSSVFAHELSELYTAFVARRPSPLPELPIQYADFAVWQRGWLGAEAIERQLDYWRNQLADLPVLELPTDRPRPAVFTYLGRSYSFDLSKGLAAELQSVAQREGCTLFMALLAGFETLLHRYSGQDEIVIGSPIANRNRRELEPLIGFFVNILLLRIDVAGNPTHREMMRRVKETTLAAFANQDVPFERLVEELQPERQLDRNPLFQVIMQLHNNPAGRRETPPPSLVSIEVDRATVKFDLRLDFLHFEDRLRCKIEYSTDLFDPARIERMAEHLSAIYEAMVRSPEQRIGDVKLVRGAERRQILRWARTAERAPLYDTIDGRFLRTAERQPDAPALLLGERVVTYGELSARSAALAGELAEQGIAPGEIVAMTAARGIAAVVAQLGILRAGGAYLPVDPSDPEERCRFMLHNVGSRVLVDACGAGAWFETMGLRLVTVAADGPIPTRSFVGARSVPDAPAYVMYTSGSTGTPKAVAVTHRGVARLVTDVPYCAVDARETFLLLAPLTFDATTFEIWAPLLNGGRLAIYPEPRLSLEELQRVITRHRVTTLFLTTGLLNEVVDSAPDLFGSVHQLLFGGDVASPVHLRRLVERHPDLTLIHCYGPTENTVYSTAQRLDPRRDLDSQVPIGRAVPWSATFVVDRYGDLAPIGIPGELLVAGDGVALGYLSDPRLTAERFVPDPFSATSGRLYRTGDRVRLGSDGTLTFIGRIDRQLKIRGFRVEPGEIEAELTRHPDVQDAVVVPHAGENGAKQLVAYVVPREQDGGGAPSAMRASENDLIDHWRTLYDNLYELADAEVDPAFNTTGWNASDTGAPISPDEMREWRDTTVARLLAHRPRAVLEIGCGTGLIALPLVPHLDRYVGTDFSAVAVEQLRPSLASLEAGAPGKARLLVRSAEDFTGIGPGEFDTVILNSVAQYFPSLEYLLRVISGAVAATTPGGRVFLGDIRSLQHQHSFHASILLERLPPATDVAEFVRRVEKAVALEQELVLHPALFYALPETVKRISHVDLQWKRGHACNELTRYRYDVVLQLDHPPASPQGAVELDWSEDKLSLERIRQILHEGDGDMIFVRMAPNARNADAAAAWRAATGPTPPASIRELHERAKEARYAPPLDSFWEIAENTAYHAHVRPSPDRDDTCQIFYLRPSSGDACALAPPVQTVPAGKIALANAPPHSLLVEHLAPSLRRFLKSRVPEHMMPSRFMVIDSMPLTRNGKIDRAALPSPDLGRQLQTEAAYVAPRQDIERRLAEIWAGVLNVDRVGIQDNFFDLGGDSILCLQVISRAKAAGLHLTTKQMFENQTVAALAAVASTSQVVNAEQGPVTGATLLLPAQAWLLTQNLRNVHHFNQTLLLELPAGINLVALDRALQALVRHHDALRLRCEPRGGTWQAFYVGIEDRPVLQHVDLSRMPTGAKIPDLERRCAEVQAQLDVTAGPMLKALLFDLGERSCRLLLAAHHLVVDGVSWRILFEDLANAYAHLLAGKEPSLPAKTTSMSYWARKLAVLADRDELQREAEYWIGIAAPGAPLPTDLSGANRAGDVAVITEELGPDETKALLTDVPNSFRAQINDVLLAAFAHALATWTGGTEAYFDLEGHGREPLFEDVDLTRTVGWFTSIFPVRLKVEPETYPGAGLRSVRDQLRAIPRRGIGFGMLQFLSSDMTVRERLARLPRPQISFNYMGQFIDPNGLDTTIRAAGESPGPMRHPHDERVHLIEVNGTIALERLSFQWTYSRHRHKPETIAAVARDMIANLRAIIARSRSDQLPRLLAAEFPEAGLGQDDLDRLAAHLFRSPGT
jgi:amino acid adenylation domain-containing protein/non-ribosomal peptide synthase protein (TIGR01720 family)